MNTNFLTNEELENIGLKSFGKNVQISKQVLILGAKNISLGDNVRVDSFSILAVNRGLLRIGSYVHIGPHVSLMANSGIDIGSFTGISHGVKIFSETDDFLGYSLTNPTIPNEYSNVIKGKVCIKKHCIIGANSVILPNVCIGEGVAVGALSLVNKNLDCWHIYSGSPVKKIMLRNKRPLELEIDLVNKYGEFIDI